MKRAAIILTACLQLSARGEPTAPATGPRYQLHTGTTGAEPITLRLDTTTGRTWQLARIPIDARTVMLTWVEIPEPTATTKPATPAANASKPPAP